MAEPLPKPHIHHKLLLLVFLDKFGIYVEIMFIINTALLFGYLWCNTYVNMMPVLVYPTYKIWIYPWIFNLTHRSIPRQLMKYKLSGCYSLPRTVSVVKSPYPTEVRVCKAHHIPCIIQNRIYFIFTILIIRVKIDFHYNLTCI